MSFWSTENPIFRQYLVHVGVLGLKVIIMAPFTSIQRRKNLIWINQEDAARRGVKPITNDDKVERVRRVHRNDLENVLPFCILGLMFVQTDPSATVATILFRTFTISRICHTIVYLKGMSQMRGNLFLIGFLVNVTLAVSVISKIGWYNL